MDANDREAQKQEEQRPVEEAGGGVAEGFEQAEADLIDNASHGDGEGDPIADAIDTENAEAERATGEYGEADDAEPSD